MAGWEASPLDGRSSTTSCGVTLCAGSGTAVSAPPPCKTHTLSAFICFWRSPAGDLQGVLGTSCQALTLAGKKERLMYPAQAIWIFTEALVRQSRMRCPERSDPTLLETRVIRCPPRAARGRPGSTTGGGCTAACPSAHLRRRPSGRGCQALPRALRGCCHPTGWGRKPSAAAATCERSAAQAGSPASTGPLQHSRA